VKILWHVQSGFFSHEFRTYFIKKTNSSQNRVKFWDGFRTDNIFEGFNWENFISRLSHKISLVTLKFHLPKISSPSFITLKPTSKSISQCTAFQSTSVCCPSIHFLQKLLKLVNHSLKLSKVRFSSLQIWGFSVFFFNFWVFSSTNQACSHKLVPDSWFNFRVYFVLLIRVFSVLNYLGFTFAVENNCRFCALFYCAQFYDFFVHFLLLKDLDSRFAALSLSRFLCSISLNRVKVLVLYGWVV